MEKGNSPRTVTSSRRIKYRQSEWVVEEFKVTSGDTVCRAALLTVAGSLLVWVGGEEPRLADAALGMPVAALGTPAAALATPLLGEGDAAVPLARRLAAKLSRPVFVCVGASFDRFTLPLVERALLSQIKTRCDCI